MFFNQKKRKLFYTPTKRSFKKLNIFLVTLIISELVVLATLQISSNKNLMNTFALATTVKPETFTELYFENHLNLPTKIKPNHPYSFKFTIHNLEAKDITYTYAVYFQTENSKLPIDQKNSITLSNGQYANIKENFSVNAPINKSLVVVNLVNKNQQIDFWVKGTK